jgi:hypothetical protein
MSMFLTLFFSSHEAYSIYPIFGPVSEPPRIIRMQVFDMLCIIACINSACIPRLRLERYSLPIPDANRSVGASGGRIGLS